MIRLIRSSRIGIIVAAAGLLIMGCGISRGEMPVVFEKAVNICIVCGNWIEEIKIGRQGQLGRDAV